MSQTNTHPPETHEGPIMIRGKGTGFVAHPNFDQDIVVERDNLGFALDGDIVEVELLPRREGERASGRVRRVVKSAYRELIGVVMARADRDKTDLYLQPDNQRIHIRPQLPTANSKDVGMKVVVSIDQWPDPQQTPIASITETLGPAGDHETEMQAIIRSGGFTKTFPEPVQRAAQELYASRDAIFAAAAKDPKRRDLREVLTFTIDLADAKDFDDALSLRSLEGGRVEVGIHIADVSHYVTEGDAIDLEARERGTSVYLVDRVIPMLPEVLSNDLCSLRPHEDRLAFSAVFVLDSNAQVEDTWFGQTLIHSDRRFSYEEAQTVLDTASGDHLEALRTLMQLSRKLRQKRFQKGAIAFEQPEVKFELDERGAPVRAYVKERTETMLMIEDFMLLANREVATFINEKSKSQNRDLAFIYRVHDEPNPDKIEELATFVHALGYEFESHQGVVEAKEINQLMEAVDGTPEANLIRTASIRSMAKAIYTTKNIGHFGLAFKFYTHFTSPIRRYPDLMVHRLLRHHLDGETVGPKETARYEQLSIQSSEREMEAVSAERDSIKFKQVEFLQNRIGEEFDAVITGVADWGIYVQEQSSLAEGMIRLSTIKHDYFEHEASKYRVRGQKSGETYRLGDPIRVKLTRADTQERQLDFALVRPQSA
ncbi:MAG: ribonuclease R [Patescibacteria group bacterium]